MSVGASDKDKIQDATGSPHGPNLDVATMLLDIGAVAIDPSETFQFASGLPSPIYCDNRIFLSHPNERKAMLKQLCNLIDKVAGPGWDAVAGVATAGIPFAAWVAMHFDKPMVYIRATEKDHGKQNRIEGGLASGKRVILIEDLITTGGSAIAAVSALREAGLVCDFCFSIFDYGFTAAATRFQSQQVAHSTLTGTEALLEVLVARNYATAADVDRIKQWHQRMNSGGTPVPAV